MAKRPIDCQPRWAIPGDEDLQHTLPGKIISVFQDFHGGLEKIEIEAVYMNDAGQRMQNGVFQHLTIDEGGQGRVPAISPQTLAQIVYARCKQYATKKGRKVHFPVWLFGSPAKGKSWRHQCTLTIDGTADELADDEDTAVDAYSNNDSDDAANRDTGFRTDVMSDMGRLASSSHVQPGELEVLTPSDASALARSPVLQERAMVQTIQGAFQAVLAEQRALCTQVRIEQSHALRDMKSMFTGVLQSVQQQSASQLASMQTQMETICKFAVDQMKVANDRADRIEVRAAERIGIAEGRVIEMSQLDGSYAESLKEIAKEGWVAFIDGMKMMRENVGREQEYERAFLGLQLQNLQSDNRKTAAAGVFSKLLPFGGAALSGVLRARGDEKSANTIDALVKVVAKNTENAAGTPTAVAEEQDEGPLPKIIGDVRGLYDSLRPDQIKELQRLMPKAAWQLFEGAADTGIEAACFACLSAMTAFLQSDQAVSMQVFGALDPPQQQALMSIVNDVQGIQSQPAAPQTPQPQQASPAAPPNGASARKLPPRPGPRAPAP